MNGLDFGRASRRMLLATASLTTVLALPVAAQQTVASEGAPATQPSEGDIVVTGIRETLQTSINQKKLETAIVDTLSSSEIGDLPALSVGEAIQTITGATTHREKGGASEIALRGLGSFLSNTTFNGRDATNGSGDRAVNFNQFPSELVNNIKIYKSQQANLIEGGVAGTIEIGTLRPLDYGRRAVQAEVKGNYSPYQDKVVGSSAWGWRGTLSYIDQFFDKTLGIAIGVQRNKTNNPEETVAGSSTWIACNANIVVANNNCTEVSRPNAANAPFYLVPNAITYRQINENDRRDAVFGSAQWRPSDRLNVNLDVQYSTREYVENRTDLNLSEARYGLTNVVFDPNTHIVQKLNGISSLESTNSILSRAEEYLGGGLAAEWKATDRLTISADGSYSRTIRREVERNARLRTDPLDVNGTRTVFNNMRIPYTYEVLPGNYAATITIDPRFNLNNPDLFWDDARMRRDENRRENEIWAGRADARYATDGFLNAIMVGGRWARQTYSDYDDRCYSVIEEITITEHTSEEFVISFPNLIKVTIACNMNRTQSKWLSKLNVHTINILHPICLKNNTVRHLILNELHPYSVYKVPSVRTITANSFASTAYLIQALDIVTLNLDFNEYLTPYQKHVSGQLSQSISTILCDVNFNSSGRVCIMYFDSHFIAASELRIRLPNVECNIQTSPYTDGLHIFGYGTSIHGDIQTSINSISSNASFIVLEKVEIDTNILLSLVKNSSKLLVIRCYRCLFYKYGTGGYMRTYDMKSFITEIKSTAKHVLIYLQDVYGSVLFDSHNNYTHYHKI